jgi:hypothetical protein
MTMDRVAEARSATASISALAGYPGLELVGGLADGSIRRPSMAETLPFDLLPQEEGKARGRTVITLEGRTEDAEGRLHAHGTSTCLVVRRQP